MIRTLRSPLWILGIVLATGISTAPAVHAQAAPNQSDTSGTNVFNNTAPRFGPRPGANADLIRTATRLSQELTDAQNAYNQAEQAATQSVRRFARGPGQPCVNPALARLNQAIQQAQTFVQQLDSQELQRLRATPGLKIW